MAAESLLDEAENEYQRYRREIGEAYWVAKKSFLATEQLKRNRHDDCDRCGLCLNTGLIHRCAIDPVAPDVLEVMRFNQLPFAKKAAEQRRTVAKGFHIAA
jgi:hypothetical protein